VHSHLTQETLTQLIGLQVQPPRQFVHVRRCFIFQTFLDVFLPGSKQISASDRSLLSEFRRRTHAARQWV